MPRKKPQSYNNTSGNEESKEQFAWLIEVRRGQADGRQYAETNCDLVIAVV